MLHDLAVAQVVPEALAGAEADQAQEAVRALAARIPGGCAALLPNRPDGESGSFLTDVRIAALK